MSAVEEKVRRATLLMTLDAVFLPVGFVASSRVREATSQAILPPARQSFGRFMNRVRS